MARKTNEQFVREVKELVGDEYTFLDEYIKNDVKLRCRHNKCGNVWEQTPVGFLHQGNRCKECRLKKRTKTTAQFEKEVHELVGDEYTFLGDYIKSDVKILCRHNSCGHEWKTKPNTFLSGGKRCPKCSGLVPPTDEEFKRELDVKLNREYINLEPFVNYSTPIKFKHIVCGYEYITEPSRLVGEGRRCPYCFGRDKYIDSNFKDKVKELVGEEYTYGGKYEGAHNYLTFTHQKCGQVYEVTPSNFLKGRRCPKCFGKIKFTDEDIKQKTYEATDGEYEFVEEYKGNKVPILCHHKACGTKWKTSTDNFFSNGSRCPMCVASSGEVRVGEFLNSQGIIFEPQATFEGLKYKNSLLVDFYLPEHNLVIEYDGIQHFEPIDYFGGEEGFRLTKIRDGIKNRYFEEHDTIELLRIPYWEFDNIEKILEERLALRTT